MPCLNGLPVAGAADPLGAVEDILCERQFGGSNLRLSWDKTLYYTLVRRFLPPRLRTALHRLQGTDRLKTDDEKLLHWPVEDRYVRFTVSALAQAMAIKGIYECRYIHFWPQGLRYAVVLTHDVEGPEGQRFASRLADLEERYGLRSSFNFVPESYALDTGLMRELADRGFEIGVHGLNHDGHLFRSESAFKDRVGGINRYLKHWNAVGYRSPFTHRNPDWMQQLDIEYDCTFFDTDPFETMPGGTMSIWPFVMGKFVEVPFTMVQDSTLLYNLRDLSGDVWMQKRQFISDNFGMLHLPTHPDYLRHRQLLAMYERLLQRITGEADYWNALPRDVARWWRLRGQTPVPASDKDSGGWHVPGLPHATVGRIERAGNQLTIVPDSNPVPWV